MQGYWVPKEIRIAPPLDESLRPGPVRRHYALLLNPFYPKDPHASFGKHVLTPSLALTSIAAAPRRLGGALLGREPAARTAAVRSRSRRSSASPST